MRIIFDNQSSSAVKVQISNTVFVLNNNEQYVYENTLLTKSCEISFMNMNKSTVEQRETEIIYNLKIDTIILCCLEISQKDVSITIGQETKKYQNHTQYEYFKINIDGLKTINVSHSITNQELLKSSPIQQNTNRKKTIKHLIKKSFGDAILDGGLLSLLLGWIFSIWMGLLIFILVFLIALLVNSIMIKVSNSKHRVVNWVRDSELSDDIEYFVKHLEKYCE